LLNAAPDLRAQIGANKVLHPGGPVRGSPIEAVILTGAEIDQTAGLLNLRERHSFALFATGSTLAMLDDNPMFSALASDLVERKVIAVDTAFRLPGGLSAELFAVPGKVPLYLEDGMCETAIENSTNVGVEITRDGGTLVFVPAVAAITPSLKDRLARADVVFFDGTVFTDDEMIASGAGTKTGRRMGHVPIDGRDGSLASLAGLAGRHIYIHINNTNPVLIGGSPERRLVEAAGWEIATDGLEVVL
jgi:pyrroloquinoline quinone biosynthesis protein B